MQGSLFKRTLYALAAACAVAATAVAGFAQAVERTRYAMADCITSVWARLRHFAVKVFSGPAGMVERAEVVARTHLVAAERYALRLVKRERPVIRAEWRMCPSV